MTIWNISINSNPKFRKESGSATSKRRMALDKPIDILDEEQGVDRGSDDVGGILGDIFHKVVAIDGLQFTEKIRRLWISREQKFQTYVRAQSREGQEEKQTRNLSPSRNNAVYTCSSKSS